MLPKKINNSSDSSQKLAVGALVDFEHSGKPLLGTIVGEKKGKWSILSQRGRILELPADRLYLLPGKMPAEHANTSAQEDYLNTLATAAESTALNINLSELWETVQGTAKEFEISELTELAFTNAGALERLAMKRALTNDPIYFKRKRYSFEVRPQAVVEELIIKAQVEAEKHKQQMALVNSIIAKLEGEKLQEFPHSINVIEELAVFGNSANRAKEALAILEQISETYPDYNRGRAEDRAFQLLVDIAYFDPHEQISLRRFQRPTNFDLQVTDEAQAVAERFKPEKFTNLVDHTDLHVITIDGADTRDMDDAVSVEKNATGYRVGIHITDVSSAIEDNSLLFTEALKRATSIYCPDRHISMLPTELSEQSLSLVAGNVRAVLTFFIEFDTSFNIINRSIEHSRIIVKERLTYDMVDHALYNETATSSAIAAETKNMLEALWNITVALEERRREAGSFAFNRKELNPLVDKNGRVTLEEINEDSPGRKLVGELMILANESAATFAAQTNLALIFRGQEAPESDMSSYAEHVTEGPARDFLKRGLIKRSEISTKPLVHSGLGLKAYTQVTSPIRRATDLINQKQLIAFLHDNEVRYHENQLTEFLQLLQQPLEEANIIQRERTRYWMLQYIKQENIKSLTGTIVRLDGAKPLAEVEILNYAMPFHSKDPNRDRSALYKLGEAITLQIEQVDPRKDILTLRDKS